ncbi:hypothetical protein RIF29_36982 [Crotalaria pallida]|uniref:Uncharacterized protein n=1 Tax=Crotalaria pallida TaxID=3830 RepID=A0AAN9EBV7_CROPI
MGCLAALLLPISFTTVSTNPLAIVDDGEDGDANDGEGLSDGNNCKGEGKKLKGSPMEKLARPCDIEHMRMAMLRHEVTFKEQVYELHRLYWIQKMLMKNMETGRGIELSQGGWNFKNAISLTQNGQHKGAQQKPKMKFDLEGLDLEDIAESGNNRLIDITNETEIELTLGPSTYNRKKVETSLTSDSRHSLTSFSTGCNFINNARCRTHQSSHSTKEELNGGIIGLVQVPHSTSGYQSGNRNSYDIIEQSIQGRSKQSPWLLQVLSLNMA